jgi:hypothetical protein
MQKKLLVEYPDLIRFKQLALPEIEMEGEEVQDGFALTPQQARERSETCRRMLERLFEQEQKDADWVGTYRMLRDAGWHWRMACYIAWQSSPRKLRWPKNQDELATQVLGLTSDRVITTWRQKNPAIDELVSLMQSIPLMADRADVFRALATSAADADHRSNPDRKLFFEMTGDYTPRTKVDIRKDVGDLSQYSEEELERIAKLGEEK